MKWIVVFAVLFASLNAKMFSQENVAQSLTVGNQWIFEKWIDVSRTFDGYLRYEVTGHTNINGTEYALISRTGLPDLYYRSDSDGIFAYNTDDSTEYNVIDFSVDDSSHIYYALHIDIIEFWGIPRKRIKYKNIGEYTNYTYIYGLGLQKSDYFGHGPDFGKTLVAGMIDGVIYGDASLVSANGEKDVLRNRFALRQNYPNPFNPETKISFTLLEESEITMEVFNTLGEKIATIAEGTFEIGTHEINFDASGLSSGIYYYSLKFNGGLDVKKMVLLR